MVGVAKGALESVIPYIHEREAFGQPIANFQVCVCMHTYKHVCIYTCMHLCLHACMCVYACMHVCTYMYTLCIAFRKFARKYIQVLEKYGWSICKHIEDGVCLPAMDPFLSRHVSRKSI